MSTDTKDMDTDNHQVEKRVLIAAIAAQGLALFALASLFALLPTMVRDLQLDGTATLWTVNAYTLMTASLALVGGVLGDQYGNGIHHPRCFSTLEFAQMWEEAVRVYVFLRRCVSFLGNRHLPLLAEGNTPLL